MALRMQELLSKGGPMVSELSERNCLWSSWTRGLRQAKDLHGIEHTVFLADLAKEVHESAGIVCPQAVSGGDSVRRNVAYMESQNQKRR